MKSTYDNKSAAKEREIIIWDEFEIEFHSDSIGAKSIKDRQQKVSLMKKLKVKNPERERGRLLLSHPEVFKSRHSIWQFKP